jgi:hypothetical protein
MSHSPKRLAVWAVEAGVLLGFIAGIAWLGSIGWWLAVPVALVTVGLFFMWD